MRIAILTSGFTSQNARSFLAPLIRCRRLLEDRGISISLRSAPEEIADGPILAIDSRAFDPILDRQPDLALGLLDRWRRSFERVVYCDLTDSSTWIRHEVLPLVTRYAKGQLPVDRTVLSRPLYGRRLHTDYYHRANAVADDAPAWGAPLTSTDLAKLAVAWNSGLSNYMPYGPRITDLLGRNGLASWIAAIPIAFHSVDRARTIPVSGRFATRYGRASVAYQRQEVGRRLELPAKRLSKCAYFRELYRSAVVLSPFGWGEINQKDFEVFLAGAALLKPDMSHLETWPPLYEPGVTYAAFAWDFSDLVEQVDRLVADGRTRTALARAGQERYRHYLLSQAAAEEFCDRVARLFGAKTD
ncbi:MAG: glycosyltransferase family 1 protein [Alphaproteobacteria bacterium]|nr:glycosyltransferase family 1 protein [Alphaproteobacteria bacterium]